MSNSQRLGSYGQPTIKEVPNFNADSDAKTLRNAMKGMGTNEAEIIRILANRTNNQRQRIKASYQSQFGRDILEDLKSELRGDFEKAILVMMEDPEMFYAQTLYNAIKGAGTQEDDLIEVLFCLSNAEISEVKDWYSKKLNSDLLNDIKGDVSGVFENILVSILSGKRDELTPNQHQLLTQKGPQAVVDSALANKEAKAIFEAGEKQAGTNEEVFVRILCTRHQFQLQATFEEYKKVSGKEIADSIRSEFNSVAENALVSLVEVNQNRPGFFAKRLNKAMAGAGSDEEALIRIIITRAEIDLNDIKREYQTLFKTSLEAAVQSEVGGDFKKLLLDIINGN